MLKFITSIILTTTLVSAAQANFNECPEYFPHNQHHIKIVNPPLQALQAKEMCFDSFAIMYSGLTKNPVFSVEKLNKNSLEDAKGEERTNKFYAEARLPFAYRAQLSDYSHSGYDRGHMAPAADMPNENAMAQSFSLANIIPQNSTNNRKIWSKIETATRKYAKRAQGNVFVFTGPLHLVFTGPISINQQHKTIGKNNVWVPEKIFKLIYDESTKKSWAFIIDNTENAQITKPISYKEFVNYTGLHLLSNIQIAQ